ncbi:MAG TPA: DUF5668 domain-containing protein [Anaerolineaceae bacterium]|nr:DUF5668 domain-containing protein [Anaerolineaceae bacterium]
MDSQRKSAVIPGIILILIGLAFLAIELVPGLADQVDLSFSWPMIIIGIGVIMLVLAFSLNEPGLVIPATITGGIGSLLFYQNTTGDWGSWAYAWALIPGFVGIGLVLYSLWEGKRGDELQTGIVMTLISGLAFLLFGSFLGPFDEIGQFWPVLLVLLGVYLLFSGMFRRR